MEGLHADFFNFRDMYFGPALWTPNGYTPEFDCHKPACRLKQPDVELHGDKLAGAPFENQRYSRQLSVRTPCGKMLSAIVCALQL